MAGDVLQLFGFSFCLCFLLTGYAELSDIQSAELPYFRNVEVDEGNVLLWRALVVPLCQPYDKGAFLVQFVFPVEYPFQPPRVTFRTKIYHPNISEDGQVCLPLLRAENWTPTTTVEQVVEALVALVHSPEPEHALRPELAQELLEDRRKFMKVAEQFTLMNAERRPSIS